MIDIEIRDAGQFSKGYLVALDVEPQDAEKQEFTNNACGILIGALQTNLGATPGVKVRALNMPGRGSLEWECENRKARLASLLWAQFTFQALREIEQCYPETLRLRFREPEGGQP